MGAYLLRRLGLLAVTLWGAYTIAFVALRALPGDAIAAVLLGSGAGAADIAARRAALGLDQPLALQYGRALVGLLRGDLGVSLVEGRPVAEIIGAQAGPTAALAAAALSIAIPLGIALGALVGSGGRGPLRRAAEVAIAFAQASPVYWTGALVVGFFSGWLRLLPASGASTPVHLILPALVLGVALSGAIAQVTAGAVHEASRADYARTARAKGLPPRVILFRHILRSALPSILAVIALQIGFLAGGAALTEAFFVRPGIGRVLVSALNNRDYPVIQAILILSALIFGVAGLVADLLAAWADPRLRADAIRWEE